MASPFDFINSINDVEQPDVFRGRETTREQSEKDYVPFIVNRGFSFFPDTVLYANEINQASHIEKIAQYDFLRNSIRPRKRWSKWHKAEQDEDLDLIKEVYGYSTQKAAWVLKLLTKEQIAAIRKSVSDIGGVQGKKK
jgi:DNA polymerase II small subunit/DNA polymerase delta subunit B